jgi:DNA-3-methyladenine glycosylase II
MPQQFSLTHLHNLADSCWMDHEDSVQLFPPSDFNLSTNLSYLARSANECMYHVEEGFVTRLLQFGNEHVLIEVYGQSDGSIRVNFPAQAITPSKLVRAYIASYVWEWFDLHRDLSAFYELAEQDPLLGSVAQQFHGLRIMGIPDLFEALCWGIMGQQINLTFAYTLKRRFVESFGHQEEWHGQTYWQFPSPASIAQLNETDLRELQFTGKKAEYVIGVSNLMAEGKLSKASLLELGDMKLAEKELVRIRGIGPWTANYVMMRCLRDPSAFPIEDVGLHNAIKHLLQLEHKPSIAKIRELSSNWQGWEAYATFYLWRCLY